MGTVEVQTITVAVHNRPTQQQQPTVAGAPGAQQPQGSDSDRQIIAEPLSPSSVFDARGPSLVVEPEPPLSEPEHVEREPQNAEEIVAHRIVNDAMNELFNQE